MAGMSDKLSDLGPGPLATPVAPPRRLHRLGTVRRQEEITLRVVARRLGISVAEAQRQEQETNDIRLSALYQWQQTLKVPISELVAEPDLSFSSALRQRARLIRIIKTALAILEAAHQPSMKRLAQMVIDELQGFVPDLREIGAWHSVGRRRSTQELGRITEHVLPAEIFPDREFD